MRVLIWHKVQEPRLTQQLTKAIPSSALVWCSFSLCGRAALCCVCLPSLLCGFSEKRPLAVFNLNTKIDLRLGLKEKGSSEQM